ncbi:hypothetical protein [Enterobacter cloacae]|uniref:hypothetical protein n=1 Tax=Enterobacter cloacae TaxID=550 RepID=UPI0022E62F47|nr:hypothetical protein [Enterobacter cloacae]MDA2940435.1 hypothetical protein [Enterobacter cloacae]
MLGYAIGSFFAMLFISTMYGLGYKKLTRKLSEKIHQAWKHKGARFVILSLSAIQAIAGIALYVCSCYMLYKGATYIPDPEYGFIYGGESDISVAWIIFGIAMAISLAVDILKGIIILTFAD